MAAPLPTGKLYYRPYISDSESDSGSGSDTESTDSWSTGTDSTVSAPTNRGPDYRQFASDLQLRNAAGPNFPTESDKLEYEDLGTAGPYPTQKDASGITVPKTESSKTTITSIVMLDSRNRDTQVYPQPTALQLRLPRTYKNVTNFQIVQIKLLSSFLYFREDKNNLTITIHEAGRYLSNGDKNIIANSIRPGTYNIQGLINELTLQLNRTPIFYDYTNGFTDFAPLFASTGDYSLNFNQPGDNYYDALNNVFINNPTMTQIIQKYFQTTTAGLTSYTLDQLKVAYYYPVLKECLLDPNYVDFIELTVVNNIGFLLPEETVRSRILYTFQGLNDPIVQEVINNNVTDLDEYRVKHTFRFGLINKYVISYATNNNRITINTSQLNTSLVTLLTTKFNQYLAEQLIRYNLSLAQYNALSLTNAALLAILTDEYYYLQRMFAIYFGVNFNSYSLPYFTDVYNQIPLQNGTSSSGVSSNYDANVIAKNISPQSMNELSSFRTPPTYYWPRLTALPNSTVSTFFNLNSKAAPSSVAEYSHPYNLLTDAADYVRPFIDASGIIYQNRLYKSANLITDINPTEYTVFKFRSNVRQTLRVTALPRPTKYRYPAYNAATYDASHVKIFDNSYAYIQNAQNSNMDVTATFATSNLITIPGFNSNSSNFGIQYSAAYALWTSNVTLNIQNNRTFFTFYTPQPPGASPTDTCRYTMTVQVANIPQTQAFPSPIRMYLYHDRGAFMADISDVRNEKAIHYKQMDMFTSNTTIGSITFSAYSKQQYYVMVRSQTTTFTSMDIRVIPSFLYGTSYTTLSTSVTNFDPLADPFSVSSLTNYNYASVADSNFLRLPTTSNLWSTREGVDSNLAIYSNVYVPMGYDVSGVSTDLTDYVGFNTATSNNAYPLATTRIDPITGYLFQVGTGYNSNAQKYISVGTGNTLLTSNALAVYTAKTVPQRQTAITHWYSQVFIPNTANQPFTFSNDISVVYETDFFGQVSTIYSFPYTHDLVYPGIYSQDIGPRTTSELVGYKFYNSGLALGNGVVGVSLIPDDGVWDVNRIMLRSAWVNPSADTNRQIKYLGIYNASYLNTLTGEQVKLSNALMVFELSTAITYDAAAKNFGFDPIPGTYYEWIKSSTVVPASNAYLYGFAQTPSQLLTDSNSYYSIVPFTSDSNITTYSYLSGSLVPYPFYSDASASLFYLDGTSTPTSQYVILPKTKSNPISNLGPPAGFDESQSKYEQSIPLQNSMLQYLQPPLLINLSNALKSFGPSLFQNIKGAPVFASPCMRVPNYGLFPIGSALNLYRYEYNATSHTFSLENSFTPDIFFTNLSNSQLVAMSGNNSEFAFLGLGAVDISGYAYTLQIETYNVSTQTLQVRDVITSNEGLYPIPPGYEIIDVDSFNYNDIGGFTYTIRYGQWDTITDTYINIQQVGQAKASSIRDTTTPLLSIDFSILGGVQGITPSLKILQAPREQYGRFYIAAKTRFATAADAGMGPVPTYQQPTNLKYTVREFVANDVVYNTDNTPYKNNGLFFVDPLTVYDATVVDPFVVFFEQLIGAPSVYYQSTNVNFCSVTRLNLTKDNNTDPAAFADFTIVQNPYESMLFTSYNMYDMSNNGGTPSKTFYQFYESRTAGIPFQSNLVYNPGYQVIKSTEGSNLQPYEIQGGGGGSFWTFFNEKNRITASNTVAELNLTYDSIWGNRGDSLDFPINISNAYQIFYPTQRIVMTKVARSYDPITDISGLTYPEFPHTQMFVYDTLEKYQADLSGNKWGLESPSNYLVSDTTFSGYYFNAATLDVPLFSNVNSYYLALRNYSPTEKSQVMMRFSLPNQYDYGYLRFIDVSNEIVLASTTKTLFNSNFANSLDSFNSNFIFGSNGRVFGSNLLTGFAGSNLSNVAGFGDFLNRFISLYAIYNSNVQVLSTINTTVQSNIQNFIKTDLANIIPISALNRQRYTDPIIYSILWESSLLPQYKKAEDEWGLGWNLGYDKRDTTYDTTHVAESFYKILDDFINLRLSPEYDMNRMDTGAKENLQLTQETTGTVKAYYAKLLLANFGSYAQTLISNPLIFQIPIPKIDKLTFLWQDTLGQTINNNDCEWNMVIQVVEQMDTVKPAAPPVVVPGLVPVEKPSAGK